MVTAVQMMMTAMMTKMQQPPPSRLSPCNGALTLGLELVELLSRGAYAFLTTVTLLSRMATSMMTMVKMMMIPGLDWWW